MSQACFDALAAGRLFREMDPSILARLAEVSELRSLSSGELLFAADTGSGHDVYVVADGHLEIFRPTNPIGDISLGHATPGSVVGEFAALSGRPGSTRVKAKVPSTVVRIPGDQFVATVQESPNLAFRLLQHYIDLVRSLDDRLFALEAFDREINVTVTRLFRATL